MFLVNTTMPTSLLRNDLVKRKYIRKKIHGYERQLKLGTIVWTKGKMSRQPNAATGQPMDGLKVER